MAGPNSLSDLICSVKLNSEKTVQQNAPLNKKDYFARTNEAKEILRKTTACNSNKILRYFCCVNIFINLTLF